MPAPATDQAASGHALVVRELSAGYRGVPVVRELNLEVRPGEVVALLGPNGAGKTTTLETIAAREAGLEVLGISLVTNLAAGISPEPLHHEEVLEAGRQAAPRLRQLLAGIAAVL